MEDDWLYQMSEDLKDVPKPDVRDDRARTEVMMALSQLFLKIWMRFAIDIGLKMKMAPESEDLGMYQGKNLWVLSDTFNFPELTELAIETEEPRRHALRAECFQWSGREHIRVVFQLAEEKVHGHDVMVSYAVYQSLAKDFDVGKCIEKLRPGLGKWYLSLAQNEPSMLWNFCRDKYELVGV